MSPKNVADHKYLDNRGVKREVPSWIMTVQKWLFIQHILNLRLIEEGKRGNILWAPRLLAVT